MELAPLYGRVLGLDVHHEQVTACAIIGKGDGDNALVFQTFTTFHNDCQELARWAKQLEIELVVMESTGVYWKSVNRALRGQGLKTIVANARHLKNVPGRKTDIADSQWLAILGRAGLVRGSFITSPDLEQLRLVSRARQKMSGMLISQKNRLHKVLCDAGIRLSLVVSDLNGVSARRMIKILAAGGSIEEAMASIVTRLAAPPELIRKALEGHLTSAHLFVLRELLHSIEELEASIKRHESELLEGLKKYEWAIELLETIPGIDRIGAAMLLVEIGPDLTGFKSAADLASWAGLCPGNNESASKRKSGKIRKGNPWVRRLLCEMATAAKKTSSMLKGKYQSLVVRRGKGRSIMALAHKMLRIIYAIITKKEAYKDNTVDYEQLMVRRQAPRWIMALKKYGFWPRPA